MAVSDSDLTGRFNRDKVLLDQNALWVAPSGAT